MQVLKITFVRMIFYQKSDSLTSGHQRGIRLGYCRHPHPPLSLLWRHNRHDGVSNHQPHDCLLNHLFRCRSKKTSKLLAFMRGIHRGPVNSRTNDQQRGKCFHFMTSSCGSGFVQTCSFYTFYEHYSVTWAYDVSNHRQPNCLFNNLFTLPKLQQHKVELLTLSEGNSLIPGGFLSQRASNAETIPLTKGK